MIGKIINETDQEIDFCLLNMVILFEADDLDILGLALGDAFLELFLDIFEVGLRFFELLVLLVVDDDIVVLLSHTCLIRL